MWRGMAKNEDVMNDICDVWDWSCFCNRKSRLACRWTWQPAGAIGVVFIIVWPACHWITPCNYFTSLLNVSYSSRSNSWRDDFFKTRWWSSWWWRSWCRAGDKMIMVPRRWRSKEQDDIGHIMSLYDLHVMFVMFTSYFLRTTVVNKMIPH